MTMTSILRLLQLIPYAFTCQRFIIESRDDVHVRVSYRHPAGLPNVPAHVLAIGTVFLLEILFHFSKKCERFHPFLFSQIKHGLAMCLRKYHPALHEHRIVGRHEKQQVAFKQHLLAVRYVTELALGHDSADLSDSNRQANGCHKS